MISKRQRQLLRALDDGPRSGAELAEILGVSRRTVVREVASMSAWLESVGAGSISSDPNYHLMVTSEDAIASILSQDLTDEARVLMCVLSRPGISTAQISGETYLSVRSVRAAMDEINVRLRGVVALEARVGYGIDADFSGMGPADLLAALAIDNTGIAAELERSCGWDSLMRLIGERGEEYRLLMEPYLSQRQLRMQTLAAVWCSAWLVPDAPGGAGAGAGARAVTEFQQYKKDLLYRLVTRRAAILARISEVLVSHGIKSTREDLGSLIFDHVLRCALFPTLMSAEIQKQMRGIRMEHPFEFDFGADLSECLRAFDEHLFVEPDFLSLYVLASLEHFTRHPVSLLLVCGRPSVATINKSLIERGVDGVEVELVDSSHAPGTRLRTDRLTWWWATPRQRETLRPHVNGTSRFRACSRPTRSTASARWRCVCSTSAISRACYRARAILSCMLRPATTSMNCRAPSAGWWQRMRSRQMRRPSSWTANARATACSWDMSRSRIPSRRSLPRRFACSLSCPMRLFATATSRST